MDAKHASPALHASALAGTGSHTRGTSHRTTGMPVATAPSGPAGASTTTHLILAAFVPGGTQQIVVSAGAPGPAPCSALSCVDIPLLAVHGVLGGTLVAANEGEGGWVVVATLELTDVPHVSTAPGEPAERHTVVAAGLHAVTAPALSDTPTPVLVPVPAHMTPWPA